MSSPKNVAASTTLMTLSAVTSRLLGRFPRLREKLVVMGQMADYVSWQSCRFDGRPNVFSQREQLWKSMASRVSRDRRLLVLEFGVAWGYATRYWLDNLLDGDVEWHGFDRFTGLPRAWRRFPAGAFDAQGKPPDIRDDRITWHVGDVETTLAEFDLSMYADRQVLVLFDLDLYEPTAEAWRQIGGFLKADDLLYFDEALDLDERRVLDEMVLPSRSCNYLGSTSLALGLQID